MAPRMSYTLRVLARLLRYPDAEARALLPQLNEALRSEAALDAARLQELGRLIEHLQQADILQAESEFVDQFDRGRRTALYLFEHVHGDSRDRGQAMIDLIKTYEEAGLMMDPGELPDHLPVVLEYASTQPPQAARAFLGELAHILKAIHSALVERKSRYASVLAAVLDLAGESVEIIELAPEPSMDEAWAEPEAFGGCNSKGQTGPQPIHIQRRKASEGARA